MSAHATLSRIASLMSYLHILFISRTAFPDPTYMPYKTFKNTLNFSSKIIIFAF